MAEYKVTYSKTTFGEKLRRAALRFLRVQDIDVAMENFRGWIVCRQPAGDEIGHIFIKVVGAKEKFKDVDNKKLREEFEEVAAAWLAATDPDDCFGPVRGDVINFNALDDRALLRWEKDAVGWR